MPCTDLKPPDGLKFYQLGLASNFHALDTYLNESRICAVDILDAASEERVLTVVRKMEASRGPADGAPLLVNLVTPTVKEQPHPTVPTVGFLLGLGLNPGVANSSKKTAFIAALESHRFFCAQLMLLCRPWDETEADLLIACRDKAKEVLEVCIILSLS